MKGSTNQLTVSYEQALWKKFQQEGDEKSLSTIYSLYFDQLYKYGLRFTADSRVVEDCIQELFIKIIRNRQKLSIPESLKNYLFKAFRVYIFDKVESLKKFRCTEINEEADFHLEPHRESSLILNEEATDRHRQLQSALQKLTPRQREAIYLKYAEGFSYPEIAEMLSLTQKGAYKLVGRAIQVLRASVVQVSVLYGFWFW